MSKNWSITVLFIKKMLVKTTVYFYILKDLKLTTKCGWGLERNKHADKNVNGSIYEEKF